MTRIIVGITGASGSVYGIRLLERLRDVKNVDTRLVISRAGEKTLFQETGRTLRDIKSLAGTQYSNEEIGADIASGSFVAGAMVVAPCSVHTMSAIATGIASNLIVRAADVTLKERRKLILMVRETPLHLGHLRTMVALAEMGAILAPPMPAFYTHPESVDELVDQTVARVMDLLGLPDSGAKRWKGC